MFAVRRISAETVKAFKQHFPAIKGNFIFDDIAGDSVVSGGILYKEEPAGVVLGEYKDQNKIGIIYSLHVEPKWHNKSLEQELLRFAESQLVAKGSNVLIMNIEAEHVQNITTVLKTCNWNTPGLEATHFMINVGSLVHTSWYNKISLPENFIIRSWNSIQANECEELKRASWYPDYLSPFEEFEFGRIHEPSSLWLYYKNSLVGWIVNRQVDRSMVCCTSFFMKEEWLNKGLGLPLGIESVKRLIESRLTYACFDVLANNNSLLNFISKRLESSVVHKEEVWRAVKVIKSMP